MIFLLSIVNRTSEARVRSSFDWCGAFQPVSFGAGLFCCTRPRQLRSKRTHNAKAPTTGQPSSPRPCRPRPAFAPKKGLGSCPAPPLDTYHRNNVWLAERKRQNARRAAPGDYLCGNQNFGRPTVAGWRGDSTPSTRRCPRGRVGSMAFRLAKVDAATDAPSPGEREGAPRHRRDARRSAARTTTCDNS